MRNQGDKTTGWELAGDALRQRKSSRRKRAARTAMRCIFIILIIAFILMDVVILVRASGKRSLRNRQRENVPILVMEEEIVPPTGNIGESAITETATWQEDWVRYDGKVYEYNKDIFTFLVLGIDKEGTVKESRKGTDGGQADAVFLVIVNPDTKTISILTVNRDTMTDIVMYGMGTDGSDLTTTAQLATQHGFGDGEKLSCELTRDAVSKLFYGLPIHGYAAVNMGAISKLNDSIGGVEVTVLEDLTKVKKDWKEGTQVKLTGRDAFLYVKWRDTTVFESSRGRLARQKQYLGAFGTKMFQETKKDIALPVTLFQELNKYMVTDITADEVAYLAGELLDYHFETKNIYSLEGETLMGEKHEEFYPDRDAMRELMIQLFYREVEFY